MTLPLTLVDPGLDRRWFVRTLLRMATGSGSPPDWKNLASHVVKRRKALDWTQADLQAAGGPSTATLRHIEGASSESYKPYILRKLERGLRWTDGSVDRCLAGGEPLNISDEASFSSPQRIAAALNAAADAAEDGIIEDHEAAFLRGIAKKFAAADGSA